MSVELPPFGPLSAAVVEASGMKLSESAPSNLPIVGFHVSLITFAGLIDIVAYGEAGVSSQIRFEGSFQLRDPELGSVPLDPQSQSWEDLSVLLALRHDEITVATADAQESTLRVEFSSGRVLSAGPDPNYENWEAHGPGFMLVCKPGGGLALWNTDASKP
jgi:hypothetical protein